MAPGRSGGDGGGGKGGGGDGGGDEGGGAEGNGGEGGGGDGVVAVGCAEAAEWWAAMVAEVPWAGGSVVAGRAAAMEATAEVVVALGAAAYLGTAAAGGVGRCR